MKKFNLYLFLLLFPFGLRAQHFFHETQYVQQMLLSNPAYAGSRDVFSISGSVRKQWVGIKGAPFTQTISLHTPTRKMRNNFGFIMSHDQAGVSNQNSAIAMYAYRVEMGKIRIALGLSAGIMLGKNMWTKTITHDPGDEVFIQDSPLRIYPVAGTGIYLDADKGFFSVSMPYLVKRPSNSAPGQAELISRPVVVGAGYAFRLNPEIMFRPSVNLRYLQGSPLFCQLNALMVVKNTFWFGGALRWKDSVAGIFQIQLNPQFKLGYSYDYTLSALGGWNQGTHEITINYEFGYNIKGRNPRYF